MMMTEYGLYLWFHVHLPLWKSSWRLSALWLSTAQTSSSWRGPPRTSKASARDTCMFPAEIQQDEHEKFNLHKKTFWNLKKYVFMPKLRLLSWNFNASIQVLFIFWNDCKNIKYCFLQTSPIKTTLKTAPYPLIELFWHLSKCQ